MAIGSGMSAQIGYGLETTAGVPVDPTLFLPFRNESLEDTRERVDSESIIAGRRVLDDDNFNGGPITVGGQTAHDLYDRGVGPLFKAMFGGKATTGSGPYVHTFTPGALSSYTIQKGVPDVSGTVHPETFAGCHVASWELACEAGSIASLALTWAGMSAQHGSRVVADGVTTNASTTITSATAVFSDADLLKGISGTGIPSGAYITAVASATSATISAAASATGTGVSFTIGKALATASYPASQKLVKWNHAAVGIGGSYAPVKSVTISGDNGLDVGRRLLGSKTILPPLEAGLRSYTGTFEAEFNDLTQMNRYLAGDQFAIVVAFFVGSYIVSIAMNARYEPGLSPMVNGTGIVGQSLPFKCVGSTDAAAITASLTNGDVSIP